jgi:hypothetical protein
VRSDWMAVEHRRGIAVSSAVMSFAHEGLVFDLLDTAEPPGFQRGHLLNPDRGPQCGEDERRALQPRWSYCGMLVTVGVRRLAGVG